MSILVALLILIAGLMLTAAVVFVIERADEKRERAYDLIPSHKNMDIIGDGAWFEKHPARKPREIEPRAM